MPHPTSWYYDPSGIVYDVGVVACRIPKLRRKRCLRKTIARKLSLELAVKLL
jgi:hypothetical protein